MGCTTSKSDRNLMSKGGLQKESQNKEYEQERKPKISENLTAINIEFERVTIATQQKIQMIEAEIEKMANQSEILEYDVRELLRQGKRNEAKLKAFETIALQKWITQKRAVYLGYINSFRYTRQIAEIDEFFKHQKVLEDISIQGTKLVDENTRSAQVTSATNNFTQQDLYVKKLLQANCNNNDENEAEELLRKAEKEIEIEQIFKMNQQFNMLPSLHQVQQQKQTQNNFTPHAPPPAAATAPNKSQNQGEIAQGIDVKIQTQALNPQSS